MTLPAGGTWCADCLAKGHRCQAQMWIEDVPVCLPCADGEPCAAQAAAAAGRAESSVETRLNVFMEEEGPSAAPVVHRTPEELGLAATVPDLPPKTEIKIRPDWNDKFAQCGPSARGLRKDRVQPRTCEPRPREPRPVPRVIQGVEVTMPAGAVMGAEMIEHFAKERRKTMTVKSGRKTGQRIPEEIKAKILTEPHGMTHADVARKYGVSDVAARKLRLRAGIESPLRHERTARVAPHRAATPRAAPETAPETAPAAREMTVAPEARIEVHLALSYADLGILLSRFSAAQMEAFAREGLRAALLA